MKCAEHVDVDATGYCRQCGKALCPACTRDVRGALYCENCLANLVTAPAAEPKSAAVTGAHPGIRSRARVYPRSRGGLQR